MREPPLPDFVLDVRERSVNIILVFNVGRPELE
jgi:hypothetical protein